MYELINTSLPNGLIAGTHGFATVAMTKGVSDVLRGRLEALCAYTHRTSVHDATYYQQNPVNWFHVILPQGEHVVGRVAPSDFDYTGRTNRLARLRVFGATEMPCVGGAEILVKDNRWFSTPWQGDPKYLEEDKNTSGQLRMLNPMQLSSAPAWEKLFGGNGSRYAQQFAWQVEKNLAAGGNAIYFKTSAAWDVSGEKLLGLFVDVINLLSVELRTRVTFSTYPVSLPGGTGCALRGIYDRDKFFDASSSTQAWVDCENAKIVHAELLPTVGFARGTGKNVEANASPENIASVRSGDGRQATVKLGIRRAAPASGGDPNSYQNLFVPQKKGPDMFIVGIAMAVVVVLLVAGAFFFWMMQSNKKQMQDSGAAAAVEAAEIKELESKAEQQERLAREKIEDERKETAEREAQESAAKLEADRKAKAEKEADAKANELRKQKAEKDALAAADLAAARAKKENDAKRRQKVAYLDAKEFRRGCPSYDYDSIARKCKEPFTVDDGCCVYYYVGNSVTNEPAGYKVNRNMPSQALLRWGKGLNKKKEEVPLVRDGFVLWYNPKAKCVYIDLNRRVPQNGDGDFWFSDSSTVDLAVRYFGADPHFEELWSKYQGGKTKYLIDWKFSEKCRSVKPIPTEKTKWTDSEMIAEMQKRAVKDFNDAIELAKKKGPKLKKTLEEKLNPELEALQKETNAMWKVWKAYQEKSAKIATLNTEIKDLKKKKPKNWGADKEKKEDQIKELKSEQGEILAEGSDNPTGKPLKGMRVYANIVDLESKIKSKEGSVDLKQKEVDRQCADVAKAEEDVLSAEQAKKEFLDKFKDNIRKVAFVVRVEGEIIEE